MRWRWPRRPAPRSWPRSLRPIAVASVSTAMPAPCGTSSPGPWSGRRTRGWPGSHRPGGSRNGRRPSQGCGRIRPGAAPRRAERTRRIWTPEAVIGSGLLTAQIESSGRCGPWLIRTGLACKGGRPNGRGLGLRGRSTWRQPQGAVRWPRAVRPISSTSGSTGWAARPCCMARPCTGWLGVLPFTYPPFAAVVLAALAAVPWGSPSPC